MCIRIVQKAFTNYVPTEDLMLTNVFFFTNWTSKRSQTYLLLCIMSFFLIQGKQSHKHPRQNLEL